VASSISSQTSTNGYYLVGDEEAIRQTADYSFSTLRDALDL
jgi:hypothetical protein